MAKLICPTHGYYDASEGDCPMCRGHNAEPNAPIPLGDDMPTEIGQGGMGYRGGFGEDPTELGNNYYQGGYNGKTELGNIHRQDQTEIDIVDDGPLGLLWVKEGPRRGQIHKIKHNTVMGRSQGEILVDDPKASSSHAKITYEDDKFYIWDFGTSNGTYVNGERIRAATELNENDEIKIGALVFVIKIL